MIDKKLIHFDKNETFENNRSQIKDASIVFIKDANKIYTRGEEYQFIGWSILGTIGEPEIPIEIPEGYALFNLIGDGNNDSPYWTDVNNEIIFVKE